MNRSTTAARLARLSAHRPRLVLALWLVMLLLAALSAPALKDGLTTQVKLLNAPQSQQAYDLLARRMHASRPITETVIVRSATATVDDPAFRATVTRITGSLRALPNAVRTATDYYESGNGALVSADRHATIIPVTLAGNLDDAVKRAPDFQAALTRASAGTPFEVRTVGDGSINHELNTIAQHDLERGEAIGIPIAVGILVAIFGALAAAGLPLALAIAGITTAIGVTAVISRAFALSFIVTNFITLIGLAVGIDYALFVVERYREERRHGVAKLDAIEIAGGTATRTVVYSGMTVVLSLLGLFLVPTNIFRSLSIGAVVVVVAAVLANLTLIPALLGLLGDRVDWPRRRSVTARTEADLAAPAGVWGRIGRIVMAHPVVSVIAAVALLLAAALPAGGLQRGLAGVSTLPAGSEARSGYEILARDFPGGLIAPVEIVVDGPVTSLGVQDAVRKLNGEMARDGAFGPATVTTDRASDLTLITAPVTLAPDTPAAVAAVKRLRHTLVPAAFAGTPARVLVTGEIAHNADYFAMVDAYTPWVFAFVLGLSFLILMVAFRSVVVPLKAIVMNLLSVGAAYGLLVLVFQKGYGHTWFGFQRTPAIEAWLPLFLFAILFGLSMDYHVFLLSRIREHYDRTGDNCASVAAGLGATGKIISGAAMIMVAVFAGFAAGRLAPLQEAGFGLAVAILLDATVVRAVLVPAAMTLLGDRNWYFPSWLRWLPDLRIERPPAPVLVPVPVRSASDD